MQQTQGRPSPSIGEALASAQAYLARFGIREARRDSELLMEHALRLDRVQVYLSTLKPLGDRDGFWSLVERRGKREPIGYITKVQGFWSLDLHVEPGVFIPRRETEHLVEEALRVISIRREPKILDVGTGSGAIALALAGERVDSRAWATDLSSRALGIARRNARECRVEDRVVFLWGNLFEPLGQFEGGIDLVVSNPPYIAAPEWDGLEDEVKLWEPELALLGGDDGLRFYPDLLKEALRFLRPGGSLVLEVGANQAHRIARMASEVGGYGEAAVRKDYSGQDRVVVAHRRRGRG